jgi:hypothetical protein
VGCLPYSFCDLEKLEGFKKIEVIKCPEQFP